MRRSRVTPEGSVKSAVKALCRHRGWRYVHIQAGPLCEKGLPDAFIFAPEIGWFACEIKKPGGRLRPDQVEFMQECCRLHAPYLVVDDVEDLAQWVAVRGRPEKVLA